MIRKKVFVIIIAFSMIIGLAACGGNDKTPAASDSSVASDSSEENDDSEKEVEGTPISLSTPIDYTLGTTTVHSEWIKFAAEPYVVKDIFSPQITAVGDYLIVLTDDRKLGKYKNEGSSLKLEASWTLESDYEFLSPGPDNTFFLSGFMSPLIQMDLEGTKIASYEGTDKASINPDGQSGLITWPGSTPEKLTLSNTNATKETISELEGYFATGSCTSNEHMFLFGKAADSENNKVYVLDKNGSIVLTLGGNENLGDDIIGAAQSVLETEKYYVVLDGNLRKLALWDKEGNFAGKIDDDAIFGTDYPWICTSTIANDGTMYIGLTEGRKEENSKSELLIFKVSGF